MWGELLVPVHVVHVEDDLELLLLVPVERQVVEPDQDLAERHEVILIGV